MLNATGFGAEAAYDLEGPNKADAEAITFGEALWEKYKGNIMEDQLYQEIEEFIRTHDVHTRQSETGCRSCSYNVNGVIHRVASCDGEAPPPQS